VEYLVYLRKEFYGVGLIVVIARCIVVTPTLISSRSFKRSYTLRAINHFSSTKGVDNFLDACPLLWAGDRHGASFRFNDLV